MDYPKVATVECPACGEAVDVVIDIGTRAGTASRRECREGHVFWVRLGAEHVEVLTEEPERPA